MASNYAPLTEKDQLRTQPNVDMILAWALVKGIVRHPEVMEQIQRKTIQVSDLQIGGKQKKMIEKINNLYHFNNVTIKHILDKYCTVEKHNLCKLKLTICITLIILL